LILLVITLLNLVLGTKIPIQQTGLEKSKILTGLGFLILFWIVLNVINLLICWIQLGEVLINTAWIDS